MTRKRKVIEEDAESDFNAKYGYVGGGGNGELEEAVGESQRGNEGGQGPTFPTELVVYLRNVMHLVEQGQSNDLLLLRCAEECAGEEDRLLSFHESCRIVDRLFGSSKGAALLLLKALCRLKKKRLLELLFAGCAGRTIEKLLLALTPISENDDVEIISRLTDLLADNWLTFCFHPSASFIVRTLLRICAGLHESGVEENEKRGRNEEVEAGVFVSAEMERAIRQTGQRLLELAGDFTLIKDHLDDSCVSLVMQEALSVGQLNQEPLACHFLNSAIQYDDKYSERALGHSWEGRNSCRVWEIAVIRCDEQSRQRIWTRIGGERARLMATHPAAFFPLQALIRSTKSLELAVDMMDELLGSVGEILKAKRPTLVAAMAEAASRHQHLQDPLIKECRRFFHANKASNKMNFLTNLLTWNSAPGEKISVEASTVHGSILLSSLVSLTHCSTLSACVSALSTLLLREMATHRVASHAIQAFINSETVDDYTKNHIVKAFEEGGTTAWIDLICSPSGSFVFQSIWKSSVFDLSARENLLKRLSSIHKSEKLWKCGLFRCDLHLWKKDRKAWLLKWTPHSTKKGKKS